MQITKSLIDLILQFRCPNGDFASFDAKAMQNHLLICGKTNSKSEFQPCQLVKIKEEVKIEEDKFEGPKIPVEPASKIDEDSKAFFNSLIGKSNDFALRIVTWLLGVVRLQSDIFLSFTHGLDLNWAVQKNTQT